MAEHTRIRDVTVAEAVAAEAGTDGTPELVLSNIVSPVIVLQQRPPLAVSGYFPGTVGVLAVPIALNTSHAGIFITGLGRAMGRVNWLRVDNNASGALTYNIRRLDAPFTGFPSVRAVPGYINAGIPATGTVFSLTKTDTVAAQGVFMAQFSIQAESSDTINGPWIINNGALLITCTTVNTVVRAQFGYEVWPAIRTQAQG